MTLTFWWGVVTDVFGCYALTPALSRGERELEGIMVRITGGLLATLSLAVLVHGVSAVEVGELAPAFELPDTMGENVSLADFRGNPVAVVFYRGRF